MICLRILKMEHFLEEIWVGIGRRCNWLMHFMHLLYWQANHCLHLSVQTLRKWWCHLQKTAPAPLSTHMDLHLKTVSKADVIYILWVTAAILCPCPQNRSTAVGRVTALQANKHSISLTAFMIRLCSPFGLKTMSTTQTKYRLVEVWVLRPVLLLPSIHRLTDTHNNTQLWWNTIAI
jgi:hypothetical protein